MLLQSIYSKGLRDRWRGFVIAAFGVMAMNWMGIAAYQGIDASNNPLDLLPDAVLDIYGLTPGIAPVDLILSSMAHFMIPLILSAMLIAAGADAGAAEERWGTIGVLLSNPRSRVRTVAEKAAAMTSLVIVGALLMWATFPIAMALAGAESNVANFAAASLHIGAGAFFFGAFATAVGAWTGSTSRAAGAGSALLLLSAFGVGTLQVAGYAEPWAKLLPWYYVKDAEPVLNGANYAHVGILVGIGLALLVVAGVGFRRRDLKVGESRVSLIDRLRKDPRIAGVLDRISGRAQISGIAAKTASDAQAIVTIAAGAMFGMAAVLGLMFKQFANKVDVGGFLEGFPEWLTAMVGGVTYAEPAEWYHGEIFSILAPIAAALVAINVGARAFAGEERDRTMGVLLASPVSRTRVALAKFGALAMVTSIVGVATFAGTWLGTAIAGQSIPLVNVAAASLSLVVFGIAIGSIALFVGALTGVSKAATSTAVAVISVGWAMATFFTVNADLARFQKFSPFYYYSNSGHQPLLDGVSWGYLAVLAAIAAILVALSVWAFNRRDLRG